MTDETLFELALALPPGERATFLERACQGRPELRARVERLLAAHDAPKDAVDRPPDSRETKPYVPAREDRVDQTVGSYRLLQKLGEGGMGAVWAAEQTHPVKRRVALKLIKAGMDSARIVARFEAERQALAMMDHTGIAKVLDAGTTPDGRPFFAMELVKGVPITAYCDGIHASIEDRLALFLEVCSAVQHAHTKGIVHRDLKPSNILVAMQDGKPVAKVIDFGVAKALHQKLADRTLHTEIGQVIGTLEYMAPEQAELSAMDIDTRADVYALGVLLYELLSGSTPITRARLKQAGYIEVLRIIKEEEPPKPSTRLSASKESLASLAAQRRVEPGKLLSALKGELDWIVLKALEKDRTRRYETANGFAADVKRFLANEPIVARPPNAGYRLRKAWQRNKLAFGAAAGVAASMVVGTAVSVQQAIRADREARRVASILEELQATAPAFAEQARALAAKEHFAEAIEKLAYAAALRPDESEYQVLRGDLLQCQFRLSDAADAYRAASRLRHDDSRARAGAGLCDELQAAPRGADGKLSRASLAKLLDAMQRQQLPAAELMPVARLLGQENALLVAYWVDRLKGLPVAGDRPLAKRLKSGAGGTLALDLSDTKVADLAVLAGMPLDALNLSNATEVASLAPLRGMSLRTLDISGTKLADLSPLAEVKSLQQLVAVNGAVADLGPLKGLPLLAVNVQSCPVRDLSPLHGAPLAKLILRDTRIADLSPLAGMPLKSLDLTNTPVVDFAPLAGLPLENLYLQRNRVTDLGFVRGMPLRELTLWECFDARNYEALTTLENLELLLLPSRFRDLAAAELKAIAKLRNLPKLRQLGASITAQMGFAGTGPKEAFWKDWDDNERWFGILRRSGIAFSWVPRPDGTHALVIRKQAISDLFPLTHKILHDSGISELHLDGCKGVSDLRPLKGLPLRVLSLASDPVADLAPLRGMPLEELTLGDTAVADLAPLRGLPLKTLRIHNTRVSDLGPLRGMALEYLNMSGTPVRDVAPLARMPLKSLKLNECAALADVSPLRQCPALQQLTLPLGARDFDFLRGVRSLQRLSYEEDKNNGWRAAQSAAEFWGERDRLKPLAPLRDQVLAKVGSDIVVEMTVASSELAKNGQASLNSCSEPRQPENLAVFIPAEVVGKFKTEARIDNPAERFLGKRIRVSGKAYLRDGNAAISIERIDRIVPLDETAPKSAAAKEPKSKTKAP